MAIPNPLRQVLHSRDIRLAQQAWMLGIAAESAYLVALLVSAYQLGGIVQVGLVGVARTLPAGLLAPFLAALGEHAPRHRLLALVHLGRALAIAGLAIVFHAGGGVGWLLVIAAVEGLLATLHRPLHMSLLPGLCSAPDELVAGNVVSGAAENLGSLVGPAIGAAIIGLGGTSIAFAVPAVAFGGAALTMSRVRPSAQPPMPRAPGLRRATDGLIALREHPTAGLIVGMALTQTFVRGLLTVLLVAAAAELFGLGERGYGFLQSAIGLGGILAAGLILSRAGSARLSRVALAGLVLWGLPITVIGLLPNGALALAVLVVLGIGNATFDVGLFSILQRNVPNRSRTAVLGVLEGLIMLTVGIGSLLAPLAEHWLSLRGALIATGLILPAVVVVAGHQLRKADAAAVVPERRMRLLRGVDLFRPLPLTVVEHLAGALEPVAYAQGQPICVEGEAGDRFFIIGDGAAEVESHGRLLRTLGPGDSFGEIALLRSVPRTATVRATSELQAFALSRDDFVSAVTNNRLAVGAADMLIGRRLEEDVARA